jgi:hypothetical protein
MRWPRTEGRAIASTAPRCSDGLSILLVIAEPRQGGQRSLLAEGDDYRTAVGFLDRRGSAFEHRTCRGYPQLRRSFEVEIVGEQRVLGRRPQLVSAAPFLEHLQCRLDERAASRHAQSAIPQSADIHRTRRDFVVGPNGRRRLMAGGDVAPGRCMICDAPRARSCREPKSRRILLSVVWGM